MSRRIAVTGVGMVTSLGSSAPETFARLLQGERGFSPITLFDTTGQRTSLGAEVPDFRVEAVAPRSSASRWSRTDALALVAAKEALVTSGGVLRRGMGLGVGVTTGGMLEAEHLLPALASGAPPGDHLVSYPSSSTEDRLAETLGPFARTATLISACSSGANAIVQGAAWIASGATDSVLAGGTDALCRLTLTGFNALGATDPGPCRPFDRDRAGLTLGEGAAFLLLESEEAARSRGAEILAWLSGWAALSEAHHITRPEPSARIPASLLVEAMTRAGLGPRDVDYVNAHGTGTVANDAAETLALREVLGAEAERVFVSSSKGQLGHTLGAAGALEAAITVLALREQRVPPTGGLAEPAEDCRLRHVMDEGVAADLRAAISSSFGFGGAGTTLVFERSDVPSRASPRQVARVEITAVAALHAFGPIVGEECADLLGQGGAGSGPVGLADDVERRLDASRSRRFDRQTALAVLGAEAALASAGLGRPGTGIVAATAFGNPTRTAEFLRTAFEKGPRRAPPAEFPHLVPSAMVGNASIYLGLTGPSAVTSALEVSGEAAVLMATDWVAADLARAVVAGGAEALDAIVDGVLGPACESFGHGLRGEGSAWVVVERAGSAAARGVTPFAEVRRGYRLSRADLGAPGALQPPLGARPVVVAAWPADADASPLGELLGSSGWARAPEKRLSGVLGWHEAMGALAVAASAALIARGAATDVLVAGMGTSGAVLLHLTEPT